MSSFLKLGNKFINLRYIKEISVCKGTIDNTLGKIRIVIANTESRGTNKIEYENGEPHICEVPELEKEICRIKYPIEFVKESSNRT